MSEQAPKPLEAPLRLQYPAGWHEILTAPDAVDYRLWFDRLVDVTQQECAEHSESPAWAVDRMLITSRWQRAIEIMASVAIVPDSGLTESEHVEVGLNVFKENFDAMGWRERGLSFEAASIFSREEILIDLRTVESAPDTTG